ncbi:hypothetical protein H2199_001444 [Coniosporium tulheliwenetii]|uniref:Uncharacterized protein n=1 Tax=Coniosporium tulheliwenetii TaxID=3383036 RepID=A0ACC2ZM25_9PEZI|nr:hypothetical protein H2199_001444 [Cladosporium sp. JES 115]
MPQIVLTGTSGKLGGAVLQAIFEHNLIPPSELVISTSTDPKDAKWDFLKRKVSRFASMEKAFAGCSILLLVSSPRIDMDFNNPEYGSGREKHHIAAIHAARAAGIRHIYYTSLGFTSRSKAGVMKAHNRTEEFLTMLSDTQWTVIREGLYNESWPLYFGHYDPSGDTRQDIVVAGDGYISFAAIADLGLATAMILVDSSTRWLGMTVTLATTEARTLGQIARIVSEMKRYPVNLRIVTRQQYEHYYIRERGMDEAFIKWWATTYDAVRENECSHRDPTSRILENLLAEKGRTPIPIDQTIREMLS